MAWFFEENGVDVAFFDALVGYLEQTYCVDTDRIFALGVSSGAIMSNMLGCFRGDVLRAIVPASGMTWQNRCRWGWSERGYRFFFSMNRRSSIHRSRGVSSA